MTVLCPCDPAEMKLATEWCANKSKGPVYMRLGKRGEKNFTLNAKEKFKIGKIRKIIEGKNIALISIWQYSSAHQCIRFLMMKQTSLL